jgi:hypothetical protein
MPEDEKPKGEPKSGPFGWIARITAALVAFAAFLAALHSCSSEAYKFIAPKQGTTQAADFPGTWVDPNTHLRWATSSSWGSDWTAASSYCKGLMIGGGRYTWRLPTRTEATTLYRPDAKEHFVHSKNDFPRPPNVYVPDGIEVKSENVWTSETLAAEGKPEYAFSYWVGFKERPMIHWAEKSFNNPAALCVTDK